MKPIQVMFYTRSGCGLCEDAKGELYALSSHFPLAVREIDISTDPALEKAYFDKIPVIQIGEARLYAPIDPNELARLVHGEQNQ